MEYTIEDIARFAEGDMDQAEKEAFEKVLAANPELKSGLEHYRHVQASLKMRLGADEGQKELENTLGEMNKRYFKKKPKVILFKNYIAWASAAAAVFLVFIIWAPWKESLYRQYSKTEMPGIVERGSGLDEKKQEAEMAFNSGDFRKAASLLKDISLAEPDNAMFSFYYGVSLLETDKLEEARAVFKKIHEGGSVFKYEAAFYMALSYLKENKKAAAKEWLEKIPVDSGTSEKAQKLLKELD